MLSVCLSASLHGYLRTSGRVFVDDSGATVQLRGFGLGGWLVQEGYMWNTSGFYGSTSVIQREIIELVGDSAASQFYNDYYLAYITETDVIQLSDWGFNCLRVPFHYKFFSPDTGVFVEEGFNILDPLLEWCSNNEIYLILDMHCAPGAQNRNDFSDGNGNEAGLWVHEYNRDWTVAIWKYIAKHYSESQWIGGYDLINEPVLEGGFTSGNLRQFFIEIVDSIRSVDQNHIVFIEGNWYGNDFTSLTPPFDDNMAYSFHHYVGPSDQTSWVNQYVGMSQDYNVPLWVGEIGENSNHWAYHKIKLFDENNIGWSWWNYKHNNSVSTLLGIDVPLGFRSILNYWSNIGPRPSQSNAESGLQELVSAYLIENCRPNIGLLAAFNDPEFGTKAKPYKDHHIPGLLAAVDYDLGINGVAYQDDVYEDPDKFGGNSTSWNNGWSYRNDGVDIEKSTDNIGANYNVGWTNLHDWTGYTITADFSGMYSIRVRIAAIEGNGRLQIYYNNEPITGEIGVHNTGGWQNWQWRTIGDNFIDAGQGLLQVKIKNIEFNIKDMDFVFLGEIQPTIDIYGNFPNPFTLGTTIVLNITHDVSGNLNIYNTAGHFVKRLYDGSFTPGKMVFDWKGKDQYNKAVSSGVYYFHLDTEKFSSSGKMLLIK
ncbi:MAG TPA: carbohydrate-binding protein [Candidatus Marinimicrobia bacterium]|nr:carbohydrate-binding protein [Candidatus Neomarinimicrobiota bacterium]